MEPTDITIEILTSIRDEIRTMRAELSERIDQTNERLETINRDLSGRIDQTNERLDRLERRQTETELRLSTELVTIAGTLDDVRTLLQKNYAATIKDLDRRVTALEARAEG